MRAAALLALGALSACREPEVVETDTGTVDPCAVSPLRWDSFGEPFFTVWCTSCHSTLAVGERRYGAPEAVNFDTNEGAAAWADRIRARAIDARDMPLGGYGPPEEELARLDEWLGCGAPL